MAKKNMAKAANERTTRSTRRDTLIAMAIFTIMVVLMLSPLYIQQAKNPNPESAEYVDPVEHHIAGIERVYAEAQTKIAGTYTGTDDSAEPAEQIQEEEAIVTQEPQEPGVTITIGDEEVIVTPEMAEKFSAADEAATDIVRENGGRKSTTIGIIGRDGYPEDIEITVTDRKGNILFSNLVAK